MGKRIGRREKEFKQGKEITLKESPTYDLRPEYDSRQSFYNKARVECNNGVCELYSYNTKVCRINADGSVDLLPRWDESATTLRHVKEFLRQNGKKAETKSQIGQSFNKKDESCNEDICKECGCEPCICGQPSDKEAEYQKTFNKGQKAHDDQVNKELGKNESFAKTHSKALKENYDKKRKIDESAKIIIDISEYQPWSGAVETWDKIVEADKVDELDSLLEDIYPDGMTRTDLNDILWFDSEWVLDALGIEEEPSEDEIDDEYNDEEE